MAEVTEASGPGVSAEEFASLSSPDSVATPFGTMEFFDGVPLPATVDIAYDALDLLRGIDVFLNCTPRRRRHQLAADHPRQELVPDPAPLRATRSMVRPHLAPRRTPTFLTPSHGCHGSDEVRARSGP